MTERVDLEEDFRSIAVLAFARVGRAGPEREALEFRVARLETALNRSGEHTAWEYGYAQGYSDREKTDHDRADVEKSPNPYPVETQAGGWVRCDERMPEECYSVLVAGGIAYWDGRDWRTMMGDAAQRVIEWRVTHWMPLPTPPEAP